MVLTTEAQPVLLVFASVLAVVVPLVIAPYRNLALSTGRLADQKKHLDEIEGNNLRLAETLAMMAEEADEATSLGHIRSVRKYSLWLAEELGVTDPRALENLSFAALLHDLGKSRIPEYIRKKPTRLTDSERRRMQTHAAIGAEMAGRIGERFRTGVAPIIHRASRELGRRRVSRRHRGQRDSPRRPHRAGRRLLRRAPTIASLSARSGPTSRRWRSSANAPGRCTTRRS